MKSKVIVFLLCMFFLENVHSQELNCQVTLNETGNTTSISKSIFKKMENSISQFINNRKWSEKDYAKHQKIECDLIINITGADATSNTFTADFTIQSKRPVFNSTYETQILRHIDKSVPFAYIENQPLDYSNNIFFSNLTSLLAFYATLVIAADNETFANKGGQKYIDNCQTISNLVPTGYSIGGTPVKGWAAADAQNISGKRSRIGIILDYQANSSDKFRQAVYDYHINGLDLMADDPKKAKENILKAIEQIYNHNTTSYLAIHFVGAKVDEIVKIFIDEPAETKKRVYDMLYRLDPTVTRNIKPLKS